MFPPNLLGQCVLHGGMKAIVQENGGSPQVVEELARFGRFLKDLDVQMVTS